MAEIANSKWRMLGRWIWNLLALLGLSLLLFVSCSLGTGFIDPFSVTRATALSPNGRYKAEISTSGHMFSTDWFVTLARADGKGKKASVVIYADRTSDILIEMSWKEPYTLAILIPCEPPSSIRPRYWDNTTTPSNAIAVEVQLREAGCQFARGPLTWQSSLGRWKK